MNGESGDLPARPCPGDSEPASATPQLEPPPVPADDPLWNRARALRNQYWGRTVFLRGIVELSNHCRQNCLYCGLRRDNTALSRYRMDLDDVSAAAETVKRLGFGTVVLQAGEDPGLTPRDIAVLVMRIKRELHLAVTLSLGEWEPAVYSLWRKSGADRYLLKLETPDESLYARLRPGKTLKERMDALRILADLGYETGSGFITGLPAVGEPSPGRTDRALDAGLGLLAEFQPDMVSLGPFVPHPDTPLGGHPPGSAEENLRAMANARVRLPSAHIPVTSALGLHGDSVRLAALEVANVLMPSLTPESVRGEYAIYPGKNADERSPEARAACFRPMLENAGFTVPPGPGGAWRLGEHR